MVKNKVNSARETGNKKIVVNKTVVNNIQNNEYKKKVTKKKPLKIDKNQK